jgi:hypothetical protein
MGLMKKKLSSKFSRFTTWKMAGQVDESLRRTSGEDVAFDMDEIQVIIEEDNYY